MGCGVSPQAAEDPQRVQPKFPYNAKVQQKERSFEVVMTMPKNDQSVAKVPNGELLTVLEVDGDGPNSQGRVRWKETEGWVKMCNVIPVEPQPDICPSPQAADDPQRPRQQFPYNAKAQQTDNFAEVVMKMPKNEQIVAKVPTGEILTVLEVDGDGPNSQGRVRWKETDGWVKMCNVISVEPQPDIGPSPQAADDPQRPRQQFPYNAKAHQTDNFAEVVMKMPKNEQIVAKVPNGEILTVLEVDGDGPNSQGRVRWKETDGWVKLCNVIPVELGDKSVSEAHLADPVGWWEHIGDDDKFVPYPRDESLQLDTARERGESEFTMFVGRDKVQVRVSFQVDPNDGSIRRGTQRNLTTGRTCDIRREASARELTQKARSVMAQCMHEKLDIGVPKYTQPESILQILRRESTPLKLLRASWVTKYVGSDGQLKGLPRRQDLEQLDATDAFLPPAEVETDHFNGAVISLNIFSISYCWRAWDHPDHDGQQLRIIERELETQMADLHWHGAKFKDAGIFWDFCSLHQKDKRGRRTDQEWERFNEALRSMDIWYMHVLIMTFIVNGDWSLEFGVSYDDRGWTHFERSCAELMKPVNAGGLIGRRLMITEFNCSGRKLPLAPELFAETLAQKRFTSRGDKENVVVLYTKACMLALRGTKIISFAGIQLLRHDGKQIAAVLCHCCNLERLTLSQMDIHDDECQAISTTLTHCTSLQRLDISLNKIGDAGAKDFAKALPRMQQLAHLLMSNNQIGDVGAHAIAEALSMMQKLQHLALESNQIGNLGAKAILEALLMISNQPTLRLWDNKLSVDGRTSLQQAWWNAGNICRAGDCLDPFE